MGKYLSPTNPQSYTKRCAIIIYPDDDEHLFLLAIRGQLSALARPFMWEGDAGKTDEIAQIFTETDRDTDEVFFALECEDVPFVTGQEDMNININNTCNCGCCGGQSGNGSIVCYDSNGQPIINLPPYTPDEDYPPPTGGTWPMNPVEDLPPSGFDDWTEYDENACGAANAFYGLIVWILKALIGVWEMVPQLAQALVALMAFLPGALAAELAESAFLSNVLAWAAKLVDWYDEAIEWLQEALDYIEEHQQQIVCMIFNSRYNIPAMKINFMNVIISHLDDVFSLTAGDLWVIRQFLEAGIPFSVAMRWFTEAGRYVETTVIKVDCSQCGPADYYWEVIGGEGYCPTSGVDLSYTKTQLSYSGEIAKGGEFGSYELLLNALPNDETIPAFSNKVIRVTNDVQDQNKPLIMTFVWDGGNVAEAINPGEYHDFDLTGHDILYVEAKIQIGIYNLGCPQPVSGTFSYVEVLE